MIANWIETLAAAASGAAFFGLLGLPLARMLAPAGIAPAGMAAILGWAIFSTVSMPILGIIGFGRLHVGVLALASLAVSLAVLRRTVPGDRLPLWALPLAGLAALLPMMAVLPKLSAGGMLLSPPMFDHVKVAIVDSIVRNGLPVQNPFLGGAASPPLAYYYLWHFSAAELASMLGVHGWTGEAAMTGVTAFSSLALMMAVGQAIGGRLACAGIVLLSATGTIRPLMDGVLGQPLSGALMRRDADLGGWLTQSAWVPQHLASACCVVAAVLLMRRLAQDGSSLAFPLLGILAAAAFESSTWVGGVTFAVAAPIAGLVLIARLPPRLRARFALQASAAALVASLFIVPFAMDQIHAVAARAVAAPVAIKPYGVLGGLASDLWRQWLDIPAFWLLLVPVSLPAIALPGLAGMVHAVRRPGRDATGSWLLAATLVACLSVACLLRSTIDNNDLGWRAVLPAVLLLTCFAAALLAQLAASRRWASLALLLACVTIGLPDGVGTMRAYAAGRSFPDAAALANSARVWSALRRIAGSSERVGNNPLFLADATPWPVNISWALLSDRLSCFAGWEATIAYGALPRARLAMLDAMVGRVYGGTAQPDDVAALAWTLDCRVILILPSDGAWSADPFASGRDYTLVDSEPGQWRIYRRKSNVTTPDPGGQRHSVSDR